MPGTYFCVVPITGGYVVVFKDQHGVEQFNATMTYATLRHVWPLLLQLIMKDTP